jgi:hypothetical protein
MEGKSSVQVHILAQWHVTGTGKSTLSRAVARDASLGEYHIISWCAGFFFKRSENGRDEASKFFFIFYFLFLFFIFYN